MFSYSYLQDNAITEVDEGTFNNLVDLKEMLVFFCSSTFYLTS